ncbi:MAG: hypothetical protein WAO83_10980 [Fuerstiella sp.]
MDRKIQTCSTINTAGNGSKRNNAPAAKLMERAKLRWEAIPPKLSVFSVHHNAKFRQSQRSQHRRKSQDAATNFRFRIASNDSRSVRC